MTIVVTRALLIVLTIVAAGCAARGGVPRPFPGAALPPGSGETPTERVEVPAPAPPEAPEPALPLESLTDVVRTALEYLGVPYRNGGMDPSGFDCSGFIQYVFARHGTALPREVRDQYQVGREVELKDIRAGDLIFFETVSRGASHVGMALDEGRFIHAPSSRGVVRVEPYTASYWIRRFIGARRVADTRAVASSERSVFPGSIRSTR